jgi:hypothetical protein
MKGARLGVGVLLLGVAVTLGSVAAVTAIGPTSAKATTVEVDGRYRSSSGPPLLTNALVGNPT